MPTLPPLCPCPSRALLIYTLLERAQAAQQVHSASGHGQLGTGCVYKVCVCVAHCKVQHKQKTESPFGSSSLAFTLHVALWLLTTLNLWDTFGSIVPTGSHSTEGFDKSSNNLNTTLEFSY